MSFRMPVGSPLESRSITPPCGSGVSRVIVAKLERGAVYDGEMSANVFEVYGVFG